MLLQRRHPADLLTACFVLAFIIQAGRAEGQWCRLLNVGVDAGGLGVEDNKCSRLSFASHAQLLHWLNTIMKLLQWAN